MITDAKRLLVEGFRAHDGIHEREQYASSIVVSVIDELEMTAQALDHEEPYIETAVRCIKRCVDRLRLALEVDDEPFDRDAALAEIAAAPGGMRVLTLGELNEVQRKLAEQTDGGAA